MRAANVAQAFKRCGIPSNGVVGSCVIKQSHNYYWIVDGLVPMAIARALYEHPAGRTDIRIAGHCGCPAPGGYGTVYTTADDSDIVHDPNGEQEREWDSLVAAGGRAGELLAAERRPLFSRNAAEETGVKAWVRGYHIDSELGLYLFVQAMRGQPDDGEGRPK